MDLLESCFPYALLRNSYNLAYKVSWCAFTACCVNVSGFFLLRMCTISVHSSGIITGICLLIAKWDILDTTAMENRLLNVFMCALAKLFSLSFSPLLTCISLSLVEKPDQARKARILIPYTACSAYAAGGVLWCAFVRVLDTLHDFVSIYFCSYSVAVSL